VTALLQSASGYAASGYPVASAGAIRGFSVFVNVTGSPTTAAELLHLDLRSHRVTPLWGTDSAGIETVFPGQPWIGMAPLCLFLVASVDSYEDVYGSRGGRFALMEAGSIATYILHAASQFGLTGCFVGGFCDDAASNFLDLRTSEACLLAIVIGSEHD